MPQDLHVVQCYTCHTYQVDIVKKVKKWTCKICGEKQSLLKVHGNGSGRDCRALVQHLNELRVSTAENDPDCDEVLQDASPSLGSMEEYGNYSKSVSASKWNEFLPVNSTKNTDHEQCQSTNQNKYKTKKSLNKVQKKVHNQHNLIEGGDNAKINNITQSKYCNDDDGDIHKYHIKKKQRLVESCGKKLITESKNNYDNVNKSSHSKWSEFVEGTNANSKVVTLDKDSLFQYEKNHLNISPFNSRTLECIDNNLSTDLEDEKDSLSKQENINMTRQEHLMKDNIFVNKFKNDISKEETMNIFENSQNDINSILDF